MKAGSWLALALGAALLVGLILHSGAAAIWASLLRLGPGGLALLLALHGAVIVLMGAAWWVLARGRADARLWRFVWGRWVRDGSAEALPISQIGGFVLGARAASLAGVGGAFAAGSTVVDVTLELAAQLLYTLLGAGLLAALRPGSGFVLPALAGTATMAVLAGIFAAVQARGAGLAERALHRMAGRLLGRSGNEAEVQAAIATLQRRPATLGAGIALHLLCWIASGTETWLAWRLMDVPISLPAALAVDALLYGLRSAAFLVPNALGVQEGGFLALGALFGVAAPPALAASLVKRARDVALGAPAVLLWLWAERWGRGRGEEKGKARGAMPPPLDPGDSVESGKGCETGAPPVA